MTRTTETCWCGCGEPTLPGSAFLPGHDRKTEAALIKVEYGSIQRFLERHGYGPGARTYSTHWPNGNSASGRPAKGHSPSQSALSS